MPSRISNNQWNSYVRYKMLLGAIYFGGLLAFGIIFLAAKALGIF
jgi:hypothetical protein